MQKISERSESTKARSHTRHELSPASEARRVTPAEVSKKHRRVLRDRRERVFSDRRKRVMNKKNGQILEKDLPIYF